MRDVLQWETLQQVFYEALDVDPAGRAAFLAGRCAGDALLRRQAESLLLALDGSGQILAPPVILREAFDSQPPETIGPYRILSLLGRGGMGAVYLAEREDAEFLLKVAVKVMRASLASEGERLRFRAERQILANLNHPNIARLLDGGTTSNGAPYIVMEHVEGLPIVQHCAGLSERHKLELFRQICSAVQAAHQNLVIHRDIKPGNVLVTPEGTPKLLDFGIAKLMDPAASGVVVAASTRSFERLMTPEYASPEQVRGEAITTASDVYSLGALLFELLSGKPPFDLSGMGLAEMESALAIHPQPLPGDAGRIAEKAMHRDPARRYASADQLSEDVARLLEGRTITARPDSIAYRLRMWAQRNRALAIATGLLSVTLMLLVLSLAIGLSRTQEAQQRAERRFAEVRDLASRFLFDFHDAIRDLPGSTPARKMVIERAMKSLQSLEAEAGDDIPFRIDLARGWHQVSKIQHSAGEAHLGDAKSARESLERGIALLEPIAGQPAASLLRADMEAGLVLLVEREGIETLAELLARRRRILDLAAPLYTANPRDLQAAKLMGSALYGLAESMIRSGDLTGGYARLTEAERLYRGLLAKNPEHDDARNALALVLSLEGDTLGSAYSPVNLGRDKEALGKYLEHTQLRKDLRDRHPGSQQYRRMHIGSLNDIAALRENMGQLDESIRVARIVLAEFKAASDQDPMNAELLRDYGVALNNLGDVETTAKRYADAGKSLREALRLRESYRVKYPGTRQGTLDVASTLIHLGDLELETGRAAAAVESYRRSIALRDSVSRASVKDASLLAKQAEAWKGLGKAYATLKSPECSVAFNKAADLTDELRKDSARIRQAAAGCMPQ